MTIGTITATQALYTKAATNMARRAAAVAQPAAGTGGDGQGSSGRQSSKLLAAADPALSTAPAAGVESGRVAKRRGDAVELSGQAATTDPTSGAFTGLLEQFVRSRSSVSFELPARGPFGPIRIAFEVETAYRVIRPLQPGEVIDLSV